MLLTYRGIEYNHPEVEPKASECSLEGKYRGAVTHFRHAEAARKRSAAMRYRGISYQ